MTIDRGYLIDTAADRLLRLWLREPDRLLGRCFRFETGEFRVIGLELDTEAGGVTLRGTGPKDRSVTVTFAGFAALLSFMEEG